MYNTAAFRPITRTNQNNTGINWFWWLLGIVAVIAFFVIGATILIGVAKATGWPHNLSLSPNTTEQIINSNGGFDPQSYGAAPAEATAEATPDATTEPVVCPINTATGEKWMVGRKVTDRTDDKPAELGGAHFNGLFEVGPFSGTEKYLLHQEDVLIVVYDRGVSTQNWLPFGFNNISGREDHGDAGNFTTDLLWVTTQVNAHSGSQPVTVAQIKLVILIPEVNCQYDNKNWDWNEAIMESSANPEKQVLEAFSTGNWDSLLGNNLNLTVPWARF